ncbi:MAG: AsmA family protein [Cyanobacteria bacterium]|nr:AsmA family protein [Cyanobacteriota bacterium]MDW8202631.1 AsmA family protein [Cyanobacteriota bacterium SKYGB_h_bin112]
MNLFGRALFVGLAIAIVVTGIIWLNLDRIVKNQVERDLTTALQTTTTISRFRLNPWRGQLTIQGLTIANPANFTTPNLVTVQSIQVQLRPASLLSNTLKIKEMRVQSTEVTFEQQQLRNNLVVALSKLEDAQTQKDRGDRRFQIDRVTIQDTTARISATFLGQRSAELTVDLPDISLQNVTSENVDGMVLSEIIRTLFTRIFNAILQQSASNLPNVNNLIPPQLRDNLPDFLKQFPPQ